VGPVCGGIGEHHAPGQGPATRLGVGLDPASNQEHLRPRAQADQIGAQVPPAALPWTNLVIDQSQSLRAASKPVLRPSLCGPAAGTGDPSEKPAPQPEVGGDPDLVVHDIAPAQEPGHAVVLVEQRVQTGGFVVQRSPDPAEAGQVVEVFRRRGVYDGSHDGDSVSACRVVYTALDAVASAPGEQGGLPTHQTGDQLVDHGLDSMSVRLGELSPGVLPGPGDRDP